MEKLSEKEKDHPIWIDPVNLILSFNYEESFELISFSSAEARLTFAMEKYSSGYRIQ